MISKEYKGMSSESDDVDFEISSVEDSNMDKNNVALQANLAIQHCLVTQMVGAIVKRVV